MKKETVKEYSLDILFSLIGCTLLAASTHVFNAPNNIAPGGVTGIAILVNYLFGLPISMVSLFVNIPLLIAAYLFLGKRFTLKTLISVLMFTVMMEVVEATLPVYRGETILAALFGGVFVGAGLALVFMRGSTTGGTDIVVRLIQKKRPDFSTGRLVLILDAVVLLSAALVYRNVESALFALISIFTGSRVIDSILYGRDAGKLIMIISDHSREITELIHRELDRGCTILPAKGSFSGQDREVILCALRKPQYYTLKRLVHKADPSAFFMALETNEVIGEGFKTPE